MAKKPFNIEDHAELLDEVFKGQNWRKLEVDEVVAWLTAFRDDRRKKLEAEQEAEDRANGVVPLKDAEMFVYLMRGFKEDTTLAEAAEALRKRKRLGHKQREALQLFDRYEASIRKGKK
jgi:hypothetical protein